MDEMKENEKNKSEKIEEVINCDINKQESDFKKKLGEKRRKTALSTSDVMDQVNVIVINILNLIKFSIKYSIYYNLK